MDTHQSCPQSAFQAAALDLLAGVDDATPDADVGIVVVATAPDTVLARNSLRGMEPGTHELLAAATPGNLPFLVYLRGPVCHRTYGHLLRERLDSCRSGWFSSGSICSGEAEVVLTTQWGLTNWRRLHPEIRGPC